MARSNHLNAQLQRLSLFLLEIRVICHRHFVVESMRRRVGERGGWKERNIQTEGNVRGEERGRIFREGKMKNEWAYMGGFQFFFVFFFVLFFWVTRPSLLKSQWHNAEDAKLKLQTCKLPEPKPDWSYSPPHLFAHMHTHAHTHIYTGKRFLSIWFTGFGYILWCITICVCCVDYWQSVFRSGSCSEEMFGFCLVSAAALGVDYLWVSRWWTGCCSSMMCLWPKGVVACN